MLDLTESTRVSEDRVGQTNNEKLRNELEALRKRREQYEVDCQANCDR